MTDYQRVAPVLLVHVAPLASNAIAIHWRGLNVIWRNGIGHVMGPRVGKMPCQAFGITLINVDLEGVVFGSKSVRPVADIRNGRIHVVKRPPGSCRAYTWSGLVGIYDIHHVIGTRSDVPDTQH